MARNDHACVPVRTTIVVRPPSFEESHTMAFLEAIISDRKANDSSADNQNRFGHALKIGSPSKKDRQD